MSKAEVYTVLTTAFILLVVFSYHTNKFNNTFFRGADGLNRRLGFKIPPLAFDPLILKIERYAEENGSENPSSDDNEYFSDNGGLNITLRLMVLFPFLDRYPRDGLIDLKELEGWIMQQTIDRLNYRTQRELDSRDKDGDGSILFSEYFPQFSKEDIERNEMGHGEAGWWMEQFRNADVDHNGTLSLYEFRDFLHPEESKNEKIQKWLLRGKVRQLDYDNDQKLNLLEFRNGVYNTYQSYFEFETKEATVPSPQEVFAKLDLNKDKLLQVEELKPIFHYLCPGELSYAKYYAQHLIQEVDENGDGKLSLDETFKKDYIFYDTVYDGSRYDDEENLHDEL